MTYLHAAEALDLEPTERAVLEAAALHKQLGNFLADERISQPAAKTFDFHLGNAATPEVDAAYKALLEALAIDDPAVAFYLDETAERPTIDPAEIQTVPQLGADRWTDSFEVPGKEGYILRSVTPLANGLVHVEWTAHRSLPERSSVGGTALVAAMSG